MLHAISIFFTDIFVNLILVILAIYFCIFCMVKLDDSVCNISDVIYCAVNLFFKKFGIYTFFLFFTFFYMIDLHGCNIFSIFLFQFIVSVIFCYRRFENFSVRFGKLITLCRSHEKYYFCSFIVFCNFMQCLFIVFKLG